MSQKTKKAALEGNLLASKHQVNLAKLKVANAEHAATLSAHHLVLHEADAADSGQWNPTDPVAKKVKAILEGMPPVVSVRPERSMDDLGLVADTVRLAMNTTFFVNSSNKLSASQVTGSTTVLTLVIEIEALGGH
jgi:hypothetical protein